MNVATIDQAELLDLAAKYADLAKFSMHCVRASRGNTASRARWLQSALKAGIAADYWSLEAERPLLGYHLRKASR